MLMTRVPALAGCEGTDVQRGAETRMRGGCLTSSRHSSLRESAFVNAYIFAVR
jgi:hypothetical protein